MPHPSTASDAGAPAPSISLSARSISKSYGAVRALADVSISIPSGQSVAIMGPSGSGKSTLLHCLSGILVPDSGNVSLDGDPVSDLRDKQRSLLRRRRFGFIFQDGQLLPELPARENVALPLLLAGQSRGEALGRADEWLVRLGLEGMQKRRPGELSGGQAQRVAIARALIHSPDVIFADEPTGALDQATGHEVMQVLTGTAAMAGSTVVVVTHDDEVARWCQRRIDIRDAMIHDDQMTSGTDR